MSKFSYSLDYITSIVDPVRIVGATDIEICMINSLLDAKNGELSFLGNAKYKNHVALSNASVLLLPLDYSGEPKQNQAFLLCKDPSFALGLLCRKIEQEISINQIAEIHSSAVVSETATIGNNVSIGSNVFVGEHATIGDNVTVFSNSYIGNFVQIGDDAVIKPNVTIMDFCIIGKHVILQPGVVIGSDGFGYSTINDVHEKLPQIGNVVICDDVEIGANTTIDRARFKSTVVGRGTKIDNLVQIGHNVTIGEGCLIVSQVGISGSTNIGNYVVIGGQSGIAGHINIGDRCIFGGQTGVSLDCEAGSFMRGSPALPINQANKFYVLRKKLPELFKRVDSIEQQLNSEN